MVGLVAEVERAKTTVYHKSVRDRLLCIHHANQAHEISLGTASYSHPLLSRVRHIRSVESGAWGEEPQSLAVAVRLKKMKMIDVREPRENLICLLI